MLENTVRAVGGFPFTYKRVVNPALKVSFSLLMNLASTIYFPEIDG